MYILRVSLVYSTCNMSLLGLLILNDKLLSIDIMVVGLEIEDRGQKYCWRKYPSSSSLSSLTIFPVRCRRRREYLRIRRFSRGRGRGGGGLAHIYVPPSGLLTRADIVS